MGTGDFQKIDCERSSPALAISTALSILVVLEMNSTRPMSTYEIGLWVQDNKVPPRPLSVIMKTLAKDGYINRVALAGKRAALWGITPRGLQSLQKRSLKAGIARNILGLLPCFTREEVTVMKLLLEKAPLSITGMSDDSGHRVSTIRTAAKRLKMRRFIARSNRLKHGYALTINGIEIAKKL